MVALLRSVVDAVAAAGSEHAARRAGSVTAVVDHVVARLRPLREAVAAAGTERAIGIAFTVIAAVHAVVASFVLGLDDAVTAARTESTSGLALAVAAGLDAVVAFFSGTYVTVAALDAAAESDLVPEALVALLRLAIDGAAVTVSMVPVLAKLAVLEHAVAAAVFAFLDALG